MKELGGFMISLVGTAAAMSLIEGILPDGESTKSGFRYLASLVILLTLLSPITGMVRALSGVELVEADIFDMASVEAIARVNSITALHISREVADKFGYDEDELSAEMRDGKLYLTLPRKLGVLASDVCDFVYMSRAVETEVSFIE